MDASTVALLGVVVAAMIGVGNFIQNVRIHRQGNEIKVHVDGKLDAAIAETAATRRELDATKLLVAAMTVDHEGVIGPDVVWAAKNVIDAAQRTDVVVQNAEDVAIATTAIHAEEARDD